MDIRTIRELCENLAHTLGDIDDDTPLASVSLADVGALDVTLHTLLGDAADYAESHPVSGQTFLPEPCWHCGATSPCEHLDPDTPTEGPWADSWLTAEDKRAWR